MDLAGGDLEELAFITCGLGQSAIPDATNRIARGLVVYSIPAEGTPLAFLVEAASLRNGPTLTLLIS